MQKRKKERKIFTVRVHSAHFYTLQTTNSWKKNLLKLSAWPHVKQANSKRKVSTGKKQNRKRIFLHKLNSVSSESHI